MLAEFHARNFVILEQAALRFGAGFNAISGETGAGKSLIAGALGVVLGQDRFHTDQVRAGASCASLTAVFELSEDRVAALEQACDLALAEARDEGLVLARECPREGRTRSTVNGRPVPAAVLRGLGERLMDLSAQDEHTALRTSAHQRVLLDRFGGLEDRAGRTADAYRRLRELVDRLEGGAALREERQRELERVRHERDTLAALAPDPTADAALEERLAFLENAARVRAFCGRAVDTLYESDDAVEGRLGALAREAEDLGGLAAELREAAEHLQAAGASVEEAVRALRTCEAATDVDPRELDEARERREALREEARRHDCAVEDLADRLAALEDRARTLEAWTSDEQDLAPAAQRAAADLRKAAADLRAARERTGRRLARAVKERLQRLGMRSADFAVRLEPLVGDDASPADLARQASEAGLEEVVFTLRPNPGEPWGTLARTASGGETTRAMLAVKSALAAAHPQPVLFFDEIDAGVGGRLAGPIGEELAALARGRQVIAITHLPQIAGLADHHLVVRKHTHAGRTRATIETLAGDDRVAELAAMIRGRAATATTLAQAREMLRER